MKLAGDVSQTHLQTPYILIHNIGMYLYIPIDSLWQSIAFSINFILIHLINLK
jgi:hypothetical protein